MSDDDAPVGVDEDQVAAIPSDEAPGPAADGPFTVLLRVQDLDTQILQLQHRQVALAERHELEAAEAGLAELARRKTEIGGRRQALIEKETAIEDQLAGLEQRAKGLEQALYDAKGGASRDLQAIDDGVHHLAQRRAELEEQELELLVEQEPIDDELAQVESEEAELAAATNGLRAALAAAEVVVQAELSAVKLQRDLEAPRLPAELAERYEQLRVRLKGVGAARLQGNRCEGCHLELPSVEVERIKRLPPDAVVACDQCGRILVRPSVA